jgi:hypothetical protein
MVHLRVELPERLVLTLFSLQTPRLGVAVVETTVLALQAAQVAVAALMPQIVVVGLETHQAQIHLRVITVVVVHTMCLIIPAVAVAGLVRLVVMPQVLLGVTAEMVPHPQSQAPLLLGLEEVEEVRVAQELLARVVQEVVVLEVTMSQTPQTARLTQEVAAVA